MKSIIILVVFFSVSAIACIPSGDLLKKSEKKAFAKEILMMNRLCSANIAKNIGDLTAKDVSIFEDAQDMMVRYTIRGPRSQMKIEKIKIMGKIEYTCLPVTGITRAC